jgi:hypothetical protein
MKNVAGLICLISFCAGTVFVEYEILLVFGGAFVVFAGASALGVISGALYRAPEGDERADGLHIRQRNRAARDVFGEIIRHHGKGVLRTENR